jgi:hypothetical protein
MALVFQGLGSLAGLVSLVCFILVVIAMFKNNQTTLGIVCIVGFFVCFIGMLIAFVYGWMKSSEWNLKTIMLIWTAAAVIGFLTGGVGSSMQTAP